MSVDVLTTPEAHERRLELAEREYRAAPSLETWNAVYGACAACLRFYGRLKTHGKYAEKVVIEDLMWRGIPIFGNNSAEKSLLDAVNGWKARPCPATWREARRAAGAFLDISGQVADTRSERRRAVLELLAKYGCNPYDGVDAL